MDQFLGIYLGRVVNNNDPQKRGRVKAYIPGIAEPSTTWCRPAGRGFGFASQFGFFGTIPNGSDVLVMFEAGDIDSPWYFPADYSQEEIPQEHKPDNWVLSFGDIRVQIDIKIKEDKTVGIAKIYSANLGENYIEINGETNTITINALTNIKINSVGKIGIKGGLVEIQNRKVLPGSDKI